MDFELVDRIYESAFVPELWPNVLGRLAEIATARNGVLFISSGATHRAAASNEASFQDVRPLAESGWIATSERVARFYAARHHGFLREIEVFTEEEYADHLANDPTCRDILVPRGLGRVAATAFDLPTADRMFLTLEREGARGPVEDEALATLDALRPHLARSALMASRLQLERARAASATLAALGLAALVVDEKGQVLAANPLIESEKSFVRWRAQDRVTLADASADKLFHEALAAIDRHSGVRSFPLRDPRDGAAMVAHVIPVRRASQDVFVRGAAALVLTPVVMPEGPPVELVQSLFDFTAAEARVARSLVAGKTLDDIATDGGVSVNTVRTQLRGVMEKTGCSRQSETVALLGGIARASLKQS